MAVIKLRKANRTFYAKAVVVLVICGNLRVEEALRVERAVSINLEDVSMEFVAAARRLVVHGTLSKSILC